MRLVALVMVVILAVGSVVVGKIHWNQKISSFAGVKSNVIIEDQQIQSEDTEGVGEVEGNSEVPSEDVSTFTKNLPSEVKAKIEKAAATKNPINFAIMGSKSTASDEFGWPNLLKQQIVQAYGENVINISVFSISDKNSLEVIEEELYQDVLEIAPDILLFEPFILKDNGEVRMEHRLENIRIILDEFINISPDIYIYLQPANPLYNASYYPKEVQELKTYAENQDIAYLDHWQAWPDPNSTEIEKYIEADPSMSYKSIPNKKGHQLWADFLTSYFVSE